jgi:dipeptidase E
MSALDATRILLGGGGSAEDERPVFERFASWVEDTDSVLYLPIAAADAGEGHFAWVSSVLNPLGVRRIEMWTSLAGRAPAELDRYGAVFVGGGNTYSLLHQLRATGFGEAIGDFARRGGVVYGGSAGAIVMGWNIETCAHLDRNEVGLTDTSGLDLLSGDSVWCHYGPADDGLIRSYVKRTGSPTLVLAETAGVWVQGAGEYVSLGAGAVYRFAVGGKQIISASRLGE